MAVSKVKTTKQTQTFMLAHTCLHKQTHACPNTCKARHAEALDLEASGKLVRHAARSCEVEDIVALTDLSPLSCLAQIPTE